MGVAVGTVNGYGRFQIGYGTFDVALTHLSKTQGTKSPAPQPVRAFPFEQEFFATPHNCFIFPLL